MSRPNDNIQLNARYIDNVSTIAGVKDPIAVLEEYVVDTLGGTFDYLDLAGTSYDTGTGAVTGNITFGNNIWTVTTGTASVGMLPGSTFPYLEVPHGSVVTQDVAGTMFIDGTDRESTEYYLDRLNLVGGGLTYSMYRTSIFGEPSVKSTQSTRNYAIGSNNIGSCNFPKDTWHVHRRRIEWNLGFANWAISAGSTFDATTDVWVNTTTLGGKAAQRCTTLRGGGNAGGSHMFACHMRILNNTVTAGTDATIKTLLRNATKLALSGGIWP